MTPEEFKALLSQQTKAVQQAIRSELPLRIGKKAADLFAENFQKEGFQDGSMQPWKEVKRRQSSRVKGANSSRKILTGRTGDLGRSIRYETSAGKVTVYSDVIYADVHNEGLRAGRGKGFQMPQRQFMGDSKDIDALVEQEIENTLNHLLL